MFTVSSASHAKETSCRPQEPSRETTQRACIRPLPRLRAWKSGSSTAALPAAIKAAKQPLKANP